MPSGIYKRNQKTKNRLIEMCRKNGFKKGHKFQKGYKQTEETKRKISEALKGKKGHPAWNKGFKNVYKHSEETKRKMSEIHKRIRTGKWMKGKKLSEETKEKIGKSNKGILGKHSKEGIERLRKSHLGSKNPMWNNGSSFESYSVDWTETLKRSIRERDNYICQLCSRYGNAVHHIDYDKRNCNPDNLITLCRSCNIKVNSNRRYWINFFNYEKRKK